MDIAEPNHYKAWLSDKCWLDILALSELPAFGGFKESFKRNQDQWEEVINSNAPLELVNSLCGEGMEQFQKLCVLRCTRPDVVIPGVMQVLSSSPSPPLILPPPLSYYTLPIIPGVMQVLTQTHTPTHPRAPLSYYTPVS